MALTLRDIANRMLSAYRKADYSLVGVHNVEVDAWVGTKAILFTADVDSSEGGTYDVGVEFFQVVFSNGPKPGWIPVESEDGVIYAEPPSMTYSNCALKCACFTGDTLIPLADGYSVPIKDLVGREEFFVYSYDLDKKQITIGRGHSCCLTRENAQVLTVPLDNKTVITCTPDHLFLMKDGRYKKAEDLVPGDSLLPLYRDLAESGKACGKVAGFPLPKDEPADVYCFTVDKYENFAVDVDRGASLSSGVFVHNCPDFRYRFEKPLYDVGSLIGNWRRYRRRVGATRTMPPVNPRQIPGYCKHVYSLVQALVNSRMVKG